MSAPLQRQFPYKRIGQPEWFGPNIYQTYNETKDRMEIWEKSYNHTGEWVLVDAVPSVTMRELFVGPTILAPTILGLNLNLAWAVNGRRGGAVAVDQTNFTAANVVGGGLVLGVNAGGADDDYTAMHFQGNYPLTVATSFRIKAIVELVDDVQVGYLIGVCCAANKPTGTNAFTIPDNFLGFRLDTDAVDGFGDNHLRTIVRSVGVDQHVTDLGAAPAGHNEGHITINDAGDTVTFILNGVAVASHNTGLPVCQLQPYAAIIGRGAALGDRKELHMHDMELIMDYVIP